ncbi:MAG: endolytic transglycosylase MltG [Anaerolineae bacterium]|nr:endolytic transglycosylase MltG [Anaerolineae bacterium]
MSRFFKGFLFFSVGLLFVGAVAGGFLFILSGGDVLSFARTALLRVALSARQTDLDTPAGTNAEPQAFTIQPGDSPAAVARRLRDASLILDAELFVDYLQVSGLDRQLEAGTYFPRQTQTIPQIAALLIDSAGSSIPFRILEGLRLEEIAALIDGNPLFTFSGQDFLNVVSAGNLFDPVFMETVGLPAGASLEGLLFPDAYVLPPTITAVQLRDTILANFLQKTGSQLRVDAAAQGYSLYQMVILASIIEREAVWDDEKPLISSVYRNRLSIAMKLDADPTVQYPLGNSRGSWWARITPADYQAVISPYNTYLNNGLPPGPIASVGLPALRAAVYPAQSDYYYFRARCDGSNYHVFATTFDEHLANGC